MDDARTPEMLWNELLARCRAKDLEIPTATGLWFRVSASARGDAIVVTPAQRYYFKVSISAPRRISRRIICPRFTSFMFMAFYPGRGPRWAAPQM